MFMPYCPKCGKDNQAEAKFCMSCGTEMAPAASQPNSQETLQTQQAGAPMPQGLYKSASGDMEQTIGAIPQAKKFKTMGMTYDSYVVVLTTRRMVFAVLTSKEMQQAANDARDKAKAEGKGFFGAWGEQLKATFKYGEKYLYMPPDQIVAQNPANFAIENSTITEVKLSIKRSSSNKVTYASDFDMHVKTPRGEQTFRIDENSDNINLLKEVYGDRVKMPFGYAYKGPVKFKLGI